MSCLPENFNAFALIAPPAFQKPRLAIIDGVVTVTSLVVTNAFDRPHGQVLLAIGDLLGGLPDKAWCSRHFQCLDLAGDPMYRLTRDAFVMLVATFISFTDRKASVERLYLNTFDVLEGVGNPNAKPQLPDLPPSPTRLAAPSRELLSSIRPLGIFPPFRIREPKVIQPSSPLSPESAGQFQESVKSKPQSMFPVDLQFGGTHFDIVDRDGQPWLMGMQIGDTLGYSDEKSIQRIYSRHSDEFTDRMTGVVRLTTPSGEQETRVFSLRGAHLLAIFARTEKAKEFRRWVLDVLGKEVEHQQVAKHAPANAIPGLNINEDEFFLHVDNALGRENGKVTLLVQLVKMGGVDKWITATAQKIVEATNGKISKSSVHYSAKRLIDEGLIDHKSHQYYVFGEALRTRIKHHMLQNTDGMLALPDPAKSNGAGHRGGATTLH